MMYKVAIKNGYVLGVGTVEMDGNISQEEYEKLSATLRQKPDAPDEHYYMLRYSDLSWDLLKKEFPELEDESGDVGVSDVDGNVWEPGVYGWTREE